MDDYEDIVYDGLEFSVWFDEGEPFEIFATSNGDSWTDSLKPHIANLIFSAAKDQRNGKIENAKTDAAIQQLESQQDES